HRHPDHGVHGDRGQRLLLQEPRVVPQADPALVEAGDRVLAERRLDEPRRRIQHDAADEEEARAEPEERLPVGRSPRAARTGQRQRPPAVVAFFWSWSRTCLGLPPGCTASPMFCWTSSLTLSHAGSVVGTSLALGSGLNPITMPTLPSLKSWKAPSVRLVLPGFTCVTLCVFARSARNFKVWRFFSLLIAHWSPDFQSPPLFHIQIDHSACASSGPSGSA